MRLVLRAVPLLCGDKRSVGWWDALGYIRVKLYTTSSSNLPRSWTAAIKKPGCAPGFNKETTLSVDVDFLLLGS